MAEGSSDGLFSDDDGPDVSDPDLGDDHDDSGIDFLPREEEDDDDGVGLQASDDADTDRGGFFNRFLGAAAQADDGAALGDNLLDGIPARPQGGAHPQRGLIHTFADGFTNPPEEDATVGDALDGTAGGMLAEFAGAFDDGPEMPPDDRGGAVDEPEDAADANEGGGLTKG